MVTVDPFVGIVLRRHLDLGHCNNRIGLHINRDGK